METLLFIGHRINQNVTLQVCLKSCHKCGPFLNENCLCGYFFFFFFLTLSPYLNHLSLIYAYPLYEPLQTCSDQSLTGTHWTWKVASEFFLSTNSGEWVSWFAPFLLLMEIECNWVAQGWVVWKLLDHHISSTSICKLII